MRPAISVQKLGKSYRISHGGERGRYKTLRESLSALGRGRFTRNRDTIETFWALDDISFDVQPGEVVGIIGRNGAGKSTLLKILSRITKPTRGKAVLEGRVGSLLEVGTGFHPELSGRENIYLNGSILGMARAEIARKFDAIVDFSGVEKFLDTPVKRYSSGMYVRLAFAVAAHLDLEILVIDEVLAVGDAEFQRKCLGKMGDVARSGRTILFVSHNMAAVETLCTRGIHLESGKVDLIGTQTEAVTRYLDRLEQSTSPARYHADTSQPGPRGARILQAEVRSAGRHSAHGYPAGAPLEFVVTCQSTRSIHRPVLGIGIDAGHTQRVVTLDSRFGGAPDTVAVHGKFCFSCRLGGLALAPGEYYVKLLLSDETGTQEEIDPAFRFTIQRSDFYGNGGKIGRGVVLCPQQWEINNV